MFGLERASTKRGLLLLIISLCCTTTLLLHRQSNTAALKPERDTYSSSWRKARLPNEAMAAVEDDARTLLKHLLEPPFGGGEPFGGIAICASLHNEGRFIAEWLIYHRLMGVDRFYLYDTGCTDDTTRILAPWIDAGIVILHEFQTDPKGNFQLATLQHCSRTYSSQVDWLLDCDADEFYVPTEAFTGRPARDVPTLLDLPTVPPLADLLRRNALYDEADAIAVSRVTFKNQGIQRLPDGASVLASQTLRDVHHAIDWPKLSFTKSIVHTRQTSGWIIPWAHALQHNYRGPSEVSIINVVGEKMPVDEAAPGSPKPGTIYLGLYPKRTFEPLVMFHYVSRDLDNCLAKRARAASVRKGGWRDLGGSAVCQGDELYQAEDFVELRETNSFYAGAAQDFLMPNSVYGRLMPSLIKAFEPIWRSIDKPNKVLRVSDITQEQV